jgi:hypothetical protein
MEALLLAVRGAPTKLARIGIMKALHRHDVREFTPSEKKTHWSKRKLAPTSDGWLIKRRTLMVSLLGLTTLPPGSVSAQAVADVSTRRRLSFVR